MTEPAPPIPAPASRFLTLDDVASELAISWSQTYALVRGGHLPAIKIGGRGQWRVARVDLEDYLITAKADTAAWITAHPFTTTDPDDTDVDELDDTDEDSAQG